MLNNGNDKFFSILAHDLRSPFNSLLGYSDILLEKFSELDRDEIYEFIGYINRTAKSVFELLENLLYWSGVQNGRIEYHPQSLNLEIVIDSIINLFNGSTELKRIDIVKNIDNNLVIYCDQNMLFCILRNLVSNAIKYTHTGGRIAVTAKSQNGFAEIKVEDNGIGIIKEDQTKIFTPDIRHTTTGTNNETGTGIGLILCKEFVEKCGGKIWIESTTGKGTTFTFTIPIIPSNKYNPNRENSSRIADSLHDL
ncbi:sensor histidine kinase [Bacteroidota bacterium]